MADRRVVKLQVGYLQTIIDGLRMLGRNLDNEAWVQSVFGVSRQQALENLVGGFERSMKAELDKKKAKKDKLALKSGLPDPQVHCLDPSCPCMK